MNSIIVGHGYRITFGDCSINQVTSVEGSGNKAFSFLKINRSRSVLFKSKTIQYVTDPEMKAVVRISDRIVHRAEFTSPKTGKAIIK